MLSFATPNYNLEPNKVLYHTKSIYFLPFYTIINYFCWNGENLYFLFLSLVQLSTIHFLPKSLSPTGPYSTFIPLVLCIIIEIAKDAIQWYTLYQSSLSINFRLLTCIDKNGSTYTKYNKDLYPGEVILLTQDQICPAHGIIVKTHPHSTEAKTSSSLLTGETSLQYIKVLPSIPWNSTFYNNTITTNDKNYTINSFIKPGMIIKSDQIWVWITKSQSTKPLTVSNTKTLHLDNTISFCMLTTSLYMLLSQMFLYTLIKVFYHKQYTITYIFYRLVQSWILFNGIIPFSAKIMLLLVRNLQKIFVPNLWNLSITLNTSSKLDQLAFITHLVTDKTGTITTNNLSLVSLPTDKRLLKAAKLCINYSNYNVLDQGLTIEDQVLLKSTSHINKLNYRYIETSAFNFTFERKRSSVVVQSESGSFYIYTKGSPTSIKSIVSNPLDVDKDIKSINPEYRLLAYSFRKLSSSEIYHWSQTGNNNFESNQTFLGCICLSDTIQPLVKETVSKLSNIKISMATGDSFMAAKAFAIKGGIYNKDTIFVEGNNLKYLSDSHWKYSSLVAYNVTSAQKAFMVNQLTNIGKHRVASIGDGFNDIDMLHASSVGIAVKYPSLNETVCAQADFVVSCFSELVPLINNIGKTLARNNTLVCHNIFYRATLISFLIFFHLIFHLSFPVLSLFDGFVLKGFTILWPTLNLIVKSLKAPSTDTSFNISFYNLYPAIIVALMFILLSYPFANMLYYREVMGLVTILILNLQTAVALSPSRIDFLAMVPSIILYCGYWVVKN